MRAIILMAVAILAGLSAAGLASAGEAGKKAEIDWAKGVALEFLQITTDRKRAKSDEPTDTAGLLSAEAYNGFKDHKGASQLWKLGKYTSANILKQAVSPDGCEVIFSGKLEHNRWAEEQGMEADFRLRVAKVASSGQWQIRSILVMEREKKDQ
jgi:hypothetical protein